MRVVSVCACACDQLRDIYICLYTYECNLKSDGVLGLAVEQGHDVPGLQALDRLLADAVEQVPMVQQA